MFHFIQKLIKILNDLTIVKKFEISIKWILYGLQNMKKRLSERVNDLKQITLFSFNNYKVI